LVDRHLAMGSRRPDVIQHGVRLIGFRDSASAGIPVLYLSVSAHARLCESNERLEIGTMAGCRRISRDLAVVPPLD
jgi:hypothetical protein